MNQDIANSMLCDLPDTNTKDQLITATSLEVVLALKTESLSLVSVPLPSSLHTSYHTVHCLTCKQFFMLSEMIPHCCGKIMAAFTENRFSNLFPTMSQIGLLSLLFNLLAIFSFNPGIYRKSKFSENEHHNLRSPVVTSASVLPATWFHAAFKWSLWSSEVVSWIRVQERFGVQVVTT